MGPIRDAAREAFARHDVGSKLTARARALAERAEAERRLAEARGQLPRWERGPTRLGVADVADVIDAERQLHVANEEETLATEALRAAISDVALELPLVGVAWTVVEGLTRLLQAAPGHFEAVCREESSRLGDAMDEIRRLHFPEESFTAIFHGSPGRAGLDRGAAGRADPPLRLFIAMLAASQLPSLELFRVFETRSLRGGATAAASGAGVRAACIWVFLDVRRKLDAAFPGLGDLVAGRDGIGYRPRRAGLDEHGSPYRDSGDRLDADDEGARDVVALVDAVAASDARAWLERAREEAVAHGLAWLGGGVEDAAYAAEGRAERIVDDVERASQSARAATSAVVALRVRDALLDAGDALQNVVVVADETGDGARVTGRDEARRLLANVARIASAELDEAALGPTGKAANARAFAAQLSRADAAIADISGWLGLDRMPTLVGVEFAGAELERLGVAAEAAFGAMPSDAEILERFVAAEARR